MSVQPIFEDCRYCEEKILRANTAVECKIFPKTEIKSILSVTGSASSISEEVIENEIRFSGRAVFCVIYENSEGDIEKCECGVEFSDKTECPSGCVGVNFSAYDIAEVEVKNNNGAFFASTIVLVEILCNVEKIVSIVTGGENLILKRDTKVLNFINSCTRTTLQVDDEFELNYPIKDVLYHNASVNITDVQSSLGNVIIDGNLYITLIALQKNEKNDIVKEVRNIPFRQEAIVDGVTPNMPAFARGKVAKNNVKVVVDEDKNNSTVIISTDIDAFTCTLGEKTADIITDAYSTKNHVLVTNERFFEALTSSQYTYSERVIGASDYQPAENSEIVAAIGEAVSSLSINKDNNLLCGILNVTFLEKRDGDISAVKAMLPFEIPFTFKDVANYSFDICIEGFNYKIRAFAELECVLKIRVSETTTVERFAITDISVGAEKEENTSAISVYVAKESDTLWDVCKELGASAEKIMELNPDLQFPLKASDRIIIYRNI